MNTQLKEHYAYLIVRKGNGIIYWGRDNGVVDQDLCSQLLEFNAVGKIWRAASIWTGESQHLIKQIDFNFTDDIPGSVFIVSNVDDLIPEVKSMVRSFCWWESRFWWRRESFW